MKNIEFWAALIGAILLALYVALGVSGDAQAKVTTAIEYTGLIIIFLFGFIVLVAMATGKIDVSGLLEEKNDGIAKASMSRFQLLIFTFLIAMSFFLIVVNNTDKFPDIPGNVLMLLGISASTYGLSKGIQASSDAHKADDVKTDTGDATTTTTTTNTNTTTTNTPE
jgi:hypothetical protein